MKKYSAVLWFFRRVLFPVYVGFVFKAFTNGLCGGLSGIIDAVFWISILSIGFYLFPHLLPVMKWDADTKTVYVHSRKFSVNDIEEIIVGKLPPASHYMWVRSVHPGTRRYPIYFNLKNKDVVEGTFDMDFTNMIAAFVPVRFEDEDMPGLWKLNIWIGRCIGGWLFLLGFYNTRNF